MIKLKKSNLAIFLTSVILISAFVLAGHVITYFDGTTSRSVIEDVSTFYNITVNNTDINSSANITEVNISLPSSFTFLANSNGTDAGAHTFTNTSTILSWGNDGLVMNRTLRYFFFNATASTPGTFNITVTTTNATSSLASNISVTVNDTSTPATIEFNSPTPSNGSSLSQSSIPVNVSATDNGALSSILVRLYNSTNDQINSSISATSPLFINFTGLADGVYKFNATANDTFNNANNTPTRVITLDSVAPVVSLSRDSGTQSSLTIGISITESGSGIGSSCTDSDSGTTITGTGNSQTLTLTNSLECGTSYDFNVSCTDAAGNSGSASESFSTDSCSSSGGGGGAGIGPTVSQWAKTYDHSDKELANFGSIVRELAKNIRVKLMVGNEIHYVGVKDVSDGKVTIEVASDPQTATMSAGETKKFDVDGDGYYDLAVTINSVSSDGNANVTITPIREKVVREEAAAAEPSGEAPTAQPQPEKVGGINNVLIVLAIVIVIAIIYYIMRQRKM